YETFAECARQHFHGSLRGRLVVTAGLGGMGGAQPLAATMNGAAFLGVEVDPARILRRVETGYCDLMMDDLAEALDRVLTARERGEAVSVGLVGNIADVLPDLVQRGIVPDVLTDQTAAHDLRVGYIPSGFSVETAATLRENDPTSYEEAVLDSMAIHVRAMLDLQARGAIVFDYGNNLRGQVADRRGMREAFDIPGFVPEFIRPLFCRGGGPFRWAALSGNPADIAATDDAVIEAFPEKESLQRWIRHAREKVHFQGLPARICWLEYGERAEMGERFNRLVERGKVDAPIVIGRDHLDAGSVASPNRETEGMIDGSDAIADWPLLNAMLNTACGANWVSIHKSEGGGSGDSIHVGMGCDSGLAAPECHAEYGVRSKLGVNQSWRGRGDWIFDPRRDGMRRGRYPERRQSAPARADGRPRNGCDAACRCRIRGGAGNGARTRRRPPHAGRGCGFFAGEGRIGAFSVRAGFRITSRVSMMDVEHPIRFGEISEGIARSLEALRRDPARVR